jgi:ribosomal protein S18 acetylase RimI-like enzyme
MSVSIVKLNSDEPINEHILAGMTRLLPHLAQSAPVLTLERVQSVTWSPLTSLFLAIDESTGEIVGMLTLAIFDAITGRRAHIEDVVVDNECRGKGVGKLLLQKAITIAQTEFGANSIDLTSRPEREAANKLYQKVGFARRETNVYRYQG